MFPDLSCCLFYLCLQKVFNYWGKSFTYVLTLSSLLQTVNAQNKGFFQMFSFQYSHVILKDRNKKTKQKQITLFFGGVCDPILNSHEVKCDANIKKHGVVKLEWNCPPRGHHLRD